jgi:hypothetical protein
LSNAVPLSSVLAAVAIPIRLTSVLLQENIVPRASSAAANTEREYLESV